MKGSNINKGDLNHSNKNKSDMNKSDIKILLEKYWNCDSSLEEEQQLKTYFSQSNIDPAFSEYTDMFSLLGYQSQLSSELTLPSDSTLRIHELLDKYWDCTSELNEEAELKTYFNSSNIDKSLIQYADLFNVLESESKIQAGNVAIERKLEVSAGSTVKETSKKAKSFSIGKKWIGIAASLLLVGVLWFNTDILNTQAETAFAEYAVDSEDEALEVTMEALAFLSGKLDKSSTKIKNDLKRVGNASLLK